MRDIKLQSIAYLHLPELGENVFLVVVVVVVARMHTRVLGGRGQEERYGEMGEVVIEVRSGFVAQTSLKLTIFLPPPP